MKKLSKRRKSRTLLVWLVEISRTNKKYIGRSGMVVLVSGVNIIVVDTVKVESDFEIW